MTTTLSTAQLFAVSVTSFADSVHRTDKHAAIKWFRVLMAEVETAQDQGASLRELLRSKPVLSAYLALALQGAESIPTINPDELREFRSYCGIWRN
mgnify:CR=1 FL=1